MALATFGTTANNSLSALLFGTNLSAADMATLVNGIKDDLNVAHPRWPGAFSSMGVLTVPNRGVLQVLPGDFVCFDSRGWPILISKDTAANGPWVHVP